MKMILGHRNDAEEQSPQAYFTVPVCCETILKSCGAFLKPWDTFPNTEEHSSAADKSLQLLEECSSSLEKRAKRFCIISQALRNAPQERLSARRSQKT